MGDLISCISYDNDNDNEPKSKYQKQHGIVRFRYTQDQRRKETKQKKYRNILQELKDKEKVNGKTITQWEAELSRYNKKTLNL